MRKVDVEISVCALAILTALVVHSPRELSNEDLLRAVPVGDPSLGVKDVAEWFDRLQELLTRQMVIRVEGPNCFLYRTTELGLRVVYGYMPAAHMGFSG